MYDVPAENNDENCSYDGGDCCEYSCIDGDFTCEKDGFVCLDPSAPPYNTWWPTNPKGLILLGVVVGVGLCWCYVFCCIYVSDRHSGLLDSKKRRSTRSVAGPSRRVRSLGPGDPPEEMSGSSRGSHSSKAARAIAFAWLLFAIELGVTSYLFLQGEGRVAFKETDVKYNNDSEYPLMEGSECLEGKGPQWVSYANFYKAGVAVVSQLLLWALGEGTELPERAFVKMLVASFSSCCISGRRVSYSWQNSCERSWWGPFLMVVISGHMLLPLLIDVEAVCALDYGVQSMFYSLLGIVILCCNCSCACIGRAQGGLLYFVDAIFSGVLGTWANVTQSGLQFALVFAALPTFEVAYSVGELFACTSAFRPELPW